MADVQGVKIEISMILEHKSESQTHQNADHVNVVIGLQSLSPSTPEVVRLEMAKGFLSKGEVMSREAYWRLGMLRFAGSKIDWQEEIR